MDAYVHPLMKEHLQSVLKSFVTSAGQSLRGPSGFIPPPTWQMESKMSAEELKALQRAFALACERDLKMITPDCVLRNNSIQPMPIFIPMDTSSSGLTETNLEGEQIACFEVGGEKRLCLVQILNTVLRKCSENEVHKATTELNVYFSRCSTRQLTLLKENKVLPPTASSCGLITKTDAVRLTNKLLHGESDCGDISASFSTSSFKVYHECFGKCKGLLDPELYVTENSPCIQCCKCRRMFTPSKFVCHSHNIKENRVCHWGFDSSNWRSYLLLAKDQEHVHAIVKCLKEVKERFSEGHNYRKVKIEEVKRESSDNSITVAALPPRERLPSDFNQSPPIVLNPEKIVPFSGHDRYDRNFVPNVSLAPSSAIRKPPKKDYPREPVCDPCPERARPSPVTPQTSFEIDVSSADSDSEDGMDGCDSYRQTAAEQLRDSYARVTASATPTTPTTSAADLLREGREREWTLVQQALDGRVESDKESRANFIQQYFDSRATEQKLVHELIDQRDCLQKELDVAEEWRQAFERERERAELEIKSLHRLHRHQMEEQREKYLGEVDQLEQELSNEKQAKMHLKQELEYLRNELHVVHLSQNTTNNNRSGSVSRKRQNSEPLEDVIAERNDSQSRSPKFPISPKLKANPNVVIVT